MDGMQLLVKCSNGNRSPSFTAATGPIRASSRSWAQPMTSTLDVIAGGRLHSLWWEVGVLQARSGCSETCWT